MQYATEYQRNDMGTLLAIAYRDAPRQPMTVCWLPCATAAFRAADPPSPPQHAALGIARAAGDKARSET